MEVTENKAILKRQGPITPGILLKEFSADFLDDEYCRQWILKKLHPNEDVFCPGCEVSDSVLTGKRAERFWMAKRVKCSYCGKYFTALTDTFLSGIHMTFKEIILLVMLLGLGCSNTSIAKFIGYNEETIRIWRKKFEIIEKIRTITHNG
jgi:transposase-like protein